MILKVDSETVLRVFRNIQDNWGNDHIEQLHKLLEIELFERNISIDDDNDLLDEVFNELDEDK